MAIALKARRTTGDQMGLKSAVASYLCLWSPALPYYGNYTQKKYSKLWAAQEPGISNKAF